MGGVVDAGTFRQFVEDRRSLLPRRGFLLGIGLLPGQGRVSR
jgi:hypothetical protein